MKTTRIIYFLLAAFIFLSCNEQIIKNEIVVYSPTDAKFSNQERGFYKHHPCDLGSKFEPLDVNVLKSYRENDNITLILRLFYLKEYRNVAIPQKALDDIDKDMQTLREAGIKCLLRFAYSQSPEEPDAPLNIIEQHLDQLQPYLEKNKDVIVLLQAGFIGAWGEWYYSSAGLNNADGRNAVLKKILETLPKDRMVQVRTPAYKQSYFEGRELPVGADEAFSTSEIARVGHHNDCFMAGPDDYGTYKNVEKDKEYLHKDCLYVPMGGETCPPNGIDPADGIKAQNEMRYLRFTYLNEDYYKGVNDLWIAGGHMDNIIRELAYRFELISGEYAVSAKQGEDIYVKILVKNTGYAPLFNNRPVELALINIQNGTVYKAKLNVDPRFWHPEKEITIEANVGIHHQLPKGKYALYLNMPDESPVLADNPVYSIRFANENTWNAETGFNDLFHTITIKKGNGENSFSENVYFQ